MFEFDRYYKECQKNNRPFIKARKNQIDGNYLVLLDLNTCEYHISKENLKKVKTLFIKETNCLKSSYLKKMIFKGCNADKEFAWHDVLFLRD